MDTAHIRQLADLYEAIGNDERVYRVLREAADTIDELRKDIDVQRNRFPVNDFFYKKLYENVSQERNDARNEVKKLRSELNFALADGQLAFIELDDARKWARRMYALNKGLRAQLAGHGRALGALLTEHREQGEELDRLRQLYSPTCSYCGAELLPRRRCGTCHRDNP